MYADDINNPTYPVVVRNHPVLGIPVRSDGAVIVSRNGWTFGTLKPNGYLSVLFDKKRYYVHRLVLETFVSCAVGNKNVCDHIDRNRTHNFVWNLRWVSKQENCLNSVRHDNSVSWGFTYYKDQEVPSVVSRADPTYNAVYNRDYLAKFKDEINKRRRLKYAENPMLVRKQVKEWREKHKDRVKMYNASYRHRHL